MKWFNPTAGRLLAVLFFAVPPPVFGQAPAAAGSVFGQIQEADTGAELAGVTVTIASSPLRGITGADGRYSILLVPVGSYDLTFSRPGYERTLRQNVMIVGGEATRLDIELRLEMYELPLLEVMADPLAEFGAELRLERQESSSLVDAIGSEMFSRLAAGDVAEIMTKVTGVSVVEGKFAVIRGLPPQSVIHQ